MISKCLTRILLLKLDNYKTISFAAMLITATLLVSYLFWNNDTNLRRPALHVQALVTDHHSGSMRWANSSEFQDTPKRPHYLVTSLDKDFLSKKFNIIKTIVKPLSRKYAPKLDELMVHKLPVINTSNWTLHRTNGDPLSIQEAHQLIREPNYLVPNAVHYILPFADPVLQFHHFVCLLSGFWVQRPRQVFLWYSKEPKGTYWDMLKRNLTQSGVWHTKVLMVRRSVPRSVYKQPVLIREHQSDVMRMEALLVFGGLYCDLDVIVLRSMLPLRNYSFTIGRELPQNLCNGVFLSAPNSTLLAMWHVAYQALDDTGWGEHSLMLPNRLCHRFREHCHVEEESMDRPNFMWKEIKLIYGQKRGWDWRKKNYAMHLWYRNHKKQYDMESIKYVDSMLGDMFRYILFGNSALHFVSNVTVGSKASTTTEPYE